MKNILLSTVALVGLTAGAMAADLPMRAAPPPVMAAAPVFTWTGFYVGVNAGYAFEDEDGFGRRRLVTPAPGAGNVYGVVPARGGAFFRNGNDDDGGFTGGGQVGYNMQFGMMVAGIEADFNFVDLGDGIDNRFGGNNGFGTAAPRGAAVAGNPFGIRGVQPGAGGNVFFRDRGNLVAENEFFGTVRGRLGIAAFDRALIYVTGGLAWTTDEDGDGRRVGGTPPAGFFVDAAARRRGLANLRAVNGGGVNNDGDNIGWTIGGGVEYAFTNNISAKIEGLYVNIGDDGNNGAGRGRVVGVTNTGARIRATGINGVHDNEFAVVRAGLNFRFGTW